MRTGIMRVVVVAAMICGSASVGMVGAHASWPDTIKGGCYFNTDDPPTGTNTNTGVMGDVSVTQDSGGLPIGATVTCKIVVNGVDVPGTTLTYSGPGVQAGAPAPISFTAAPSDQVYLCQNVDFADGTSTNWFGCGAAIFWGTFSLDPTVCPLLVAHAGDYGPVTIQPDGDVDVADPADLGLDPLYDCPTV